MIHGDSNQPANSRTLQSNSWRVFARTQRLVGPRNKTPKTRSSSPKTSRDSRGVRFLHPLGLWVCSTNLRTFSSSRQSRLVQLLICFRCGPAARFSIKGWMIHNFPKLPHMLPEKSKHLRAGRLQPQRLRRRRGPLKIRFRALGLALRAYNDGL